MRPVPIVIALVIVAAVALLLYYQVQPVKVETGEGPEEGHGLPAGEHGPPEGRHGHMERMMNMCGENPPGHLINELFENHDKFEASYQVFPEERKLVWRIKVNQNPELLKLLKDHIEQMKCILESGGNPRAHDPAFQAEAKLSKYIHTKVYFQGDVLVVEKWADNDCAFDVIKGHAQIVKGFFEKGREEAMKTHEFGSPNCAEYGFP